MQKKMNQFQNLFQRGSRRALALLAFGLVAPLQTLHAAPAAYPMQPGETVATMYSVSNPNGFNVVVIDVRPPTGPVGANWLAPMFHNEFPVTANTWNRANLGEVFGVTLDNSVPPNIYVTATIAYGSASFGAGGSGGVYKLSGATGAISTFATLPADSASLGNICFDAVNNQFFVSHLGNGLIYRLSAAGAVLSTYDHGLIGRPNQSLTAIPDSGVSGLTAAGRRVWGLQMYNSRLYYGVWNEDVFNPSTTTDNEIWSIGINPGGAFNTGPIGGGGPRREFATPPISGNASSPVSDISFSKSGKMLLAERSVGASGTGYFSSAHQSRVLEYKLSGLTWVPSGVNYSVGAYSAHYNSAGGVDYTCNEDALATGDALMYPGSPPTNSSVYLYGLQIIPSGGNTPATSYQTSLLIDLDADTSNGDKTWLGDVADYRDTCGCLTITNRALDCIATNNTYAWSFCVTNGFNGPVGFLSFPDLPAGVTINKDILPLNPVLQPGEGTCVTLYLTNTLGATNLCFTVGAHSTNMAQCCSITNCLNIIPCCAYIASESTVPIHGPPPNCYTYNLTIKNESQEFVSYVYLTPDPFNSCQTYSPDVIHLTPPLAPGGTAVLPPITVCIDPKCPKPLCFLLSLHNSNLVQCCSIRHCLPPPGAAGGQPPIAIGNPADGSIFRYPTNIALSVNLGPVINFSSVVYKANDVPVASNSVAPFSAVWSNAPIGDYSLRAEGTEVNGGGVWISDPVAISVLDTNTVSGGGGPLVLVGKLIGDQVKFSVGTESGKTCCIEYTESLSAPNWKLLQANPGDGAVMTVYDSITNAPRRFYRARMY
jgi:hypothetical protein